MFSKAKIAIKLEGLLGFLAQSANEVWALMKIGSNGEKKYKYVY